MRPRKRLEMVRVLLGHQPHAPAYVAETARRAYASCVSTCAPPPRVAIAFTRRSIEPRGVLALAHVQSTYQTPTKTPRRVAPIAPRREVRARTGRLSRARARTSRRTLRWCDTYVARGGRPRRLTCRALARSGAVLCWPWPDSYSSRDLVGGFVRTTTSFVVVSSAKCKMQLLKFTEDAQMQGKKT
jgi:hypothetical protein